jgi:hypothetical protein
LLTGSGDPRTRLVRAAAHSARLWPVRDRRHRGQGNRGPLQLFFEEAGRLAPGGRAPLLGEAHLSLLLEQPGGLAGLGAAAPGHEQRLAAQVPQVQHQHGERDREADPEAGADQGHAQ